MGERTEYAAGTFSWVDLSTTDVPAAKDFYGAMFGWSAEDMPAGDDRVYTILGLGDKAVAGLTDLPEDLRDQGIPPSWLSYVTVADVDAAAARAGELGAQVQGPFDAGDAGRMAVVADPQGGHFALWQAGRRIGADVVTVPGALCWNQLMTSDVEAAQSFYSQLLGWTISAYDDTGETPYWLIRVGERLNGGLMAHPPGQEGSPTYWLAYFAVEDMDDSLTRVEELGGGILMARTDMDMGSVALAQDPQGAVFGLYAGNLDP